MKLSTFLTIVFFVVSFMIGIGSATFFACDWQAFMHPEMGVSPILSYHCSSIGFFVSTAFLFVVLVLAIMVWCWMDSLPS